LREATSTRSQAIQPEPSAFSTPYRKNFMSKRPFNLERLRVASPCPVDWQSMTGDERVRFCSECSLNVYNISAMSRAEAESFIARREGRLCLKFYRRADGTVITRDCPTGQKIKLRRRISRTAAATFATLLSMCAGVTAFAQSGQRSASGGSQQTANSSQAQKEIKRGLWGKIVDINGAAVPGMRIEVFDQSGNSKASVLTNDEGEFQFPSLAAGTYTVKTAMENEAFASFIVTDVQVSADKPARVDVTLQPQGVSVTVGIIDESSRVTTSQGTTTITLPN
jgi:hypothetical protein